jgi:hypothetical protein
MKKKAEKSIINKIIKEFLLFNLFELGKQFLQLVYFFIIFSIYIYL